MVAFTYEVINGFTVLGSEGAVSVGELIINNYSLVLLLSACLYIVLIFLAPVAQLDSASDFESEGCRFESCRVRHFLVNSE